MSTQDMVSKEIIARDFRVAVEGKIAQKTIDAIVASLLQPAAFSYFANGGFGGGLFYVRVGLTIQKVPGAPPDREFSGNGGGLFSFGLGGVAGAVLTDDLDKLYASTVSFQINLTGSYTSLLFFDADSNLLGHFQGLGAGTLFGFGGGSGNWS